MENSIRLEVEKELRRLGGVMQSWFDPSSLNGQGIHPCREALMPISAIPLGVVHGHVGVVHEGIRIVGIIRIEADADA